MGNLYWASANLNEVKNFMADTTAIFLAMPIMAILIMEFSSGGYKIRKILT